MPAPSDLRADLRTRLRIGVRLPDALTRSHLADGRVLGWYGEPGQTVVIDAEIADQSVPPALAARFGIEDFWARWTRAECGAKLAGIPITIWIGEHGLDPGFGEVTTLQLADLVVSIGWPACDPSHGPGAYRAAGAPT